MTSGRPTDSAGCEHECENTGLVKFNWGKTNGASLPFCSLFWVAFLISGRVSQKKSQQKCGCPHRLRHLCRAGRHPSLMVVFRERLSLAVVKIYRIC